MQKHFSHIVVYLKKSKNLLKQIFFTCLIFLQVKDFNDIFSKLNELASDKNRFSQRIRFMIMDIIDLRTNNWLPKHLDYKPVVNNTVQRVNSAGYYCINRYKYI